MWIAIVCAFSLWQLNQSVPAFAIRFLERKISTGTCSFHFEKVRFRIFRGIVLNNVRVHVKRTLGSPLCHAKEVVLDWDIDFNQPFHTWAKTVRIHGMHMDPFWEIPDTKDNNSFDFLSFCRKVSIEHDWACLARHIEFTDSNIFSIETKRLECDVRIRDANLYVENIQFEAKTNGRRETMTGLAYYDPGQGIIHASAMGTTTPSTVRNLTTFLEGQDALEYYDAITNISDPFNVNAELTWRRGQKEQKNHQDYRIALSGGDFRFRGRPVRRLKISIQYLFDPINADEMGPKFIISPIEAVFTDGFITGGVVLYPKMRATDLQASSTLPPRSLFQILDIEEPSCLKDFVFTSSPHADVWGRMFSGEHRWQSNYGGRVSSRHFKLFGVDFENISADWRMVAERDLFFYNVKGDCYGGMLNGDVSIQTKPEIKKDSILRKKENQDDGMFSMQFTFQDVASDRFRSYLKTGTDGTPSKGKISGNFQLQGRLDVDDLTALEGVGDIRVKDAELLRIPLFAGFTDLLGRNIIGIDTLVMQSDAKAHATVTNGIVTIEDASLDGNLMSIVANGKVRINSPEIPIEGIARVRLLHSETWLGKLVHVVTYPVSKMMEFRVYGPIGNPSWSYIGPIDRIAEATFWPREDATEGVNKGEKKK